MPKIYFTNPNPKLIVCCCCYFKMNNQHHNKNHNSVNNCLNKIQKLVIQNVLEKLSDFCNFHPKNATLLPVAKRRAGTNRGCPGRRAREWASCHHPPPERPSKMTLTGLTGLHFRVKVPQYLYKYFMFSIALDTHLKLGSKFPCSSRLCST